YCASFGYVLLFLPSAAKYIGAGNRITPALILTDDTVWCWGSNRTGNGKDRPYSPRGRVGALADGGLDPFASTPRKIEGLPAGVKRAVVGGYGPRARSCRTAPSGAGKERPRSARSRRGWRADALAHAVPARVAF
ncbi:MAG: hypothetical protein WKF84_12130, partial [Pyrinomonadaceae bacterium]